MTLTRQDILEAYRVVLDREPESEAAFATHLRHATKPELLRSLTFSPEGMTQNGIRVDVHDHHIYSGYEREDLAVIHQFPLYKGQPRSGFVTNFLGVRYRVTFAPGLPALDGKIEGYPEPVGSHQGETAEFIGTLRSVLDASGDRFRMLECGAGYGTWMAISHAAARLKGIADIHVYGVEAEKGHFEFLKTHMADNAISDFTALYGAIGTAAGHADWSISEDPASDYGGGVHRVGSITRRIEIFDLGDILSRESYWDLVHIDIQGAEGALCRGRMASITQRVRRVVIGTHSRAIDGELMAAFFAFGWVLENEKPTIYRWSEMATSLESMARVDGVQVWRNPELLT